MSREATKVLIIDDEDIIRECCLRALSARGYEVDTAADGPEGLKKAAENIYDVIFLDLVMPRMDGQEVARGIYELHTDTRLVIISGYAAEEARRKADDMGADLYLEKPFSPSDLVNAIKTVQGQKPHFCT